MLYEKNITSNVSGSWVKKEQITSGTKAHIVSEARKEPSAFKDDKGNAKTQDVAKVVYACLGAEEFNTNLNMPTIAGLIDAFGGESRDWMNRPLTVVTEKVKIGGKTVIALYLAAEGYVVKDDAQGYTVVTKSGDPQPERQQVIEYDAPEDGDPGPTEIPF